MSFQWLQMRITEEKERREREKQLLARMPHALEDLHRSLAECISVYIKAFGPESAVISLDGMKLAVAVNEPRLGGWRECGRVDVEAVPAMPGFQIKLGDAKFAVEIGLLPGDKMTYRDREHDQYLSMEDLTRRILDRALFPKLKD